MNVAVENQSDASQRKLAEAYRGQLLLLRGHVDSYWKQRAADLAREAEQAPASAAFQQIVEKGLADAAVLLNGDGSAAYPSLPVPVSADPVYERPDWMAARALENWNDFAGAATAYASIVKEDGDVSVAARAAQARIRCLLRAGDKNAALRAIDEYFTKGRLMGGTDLSGRSVAADEQLLAARLSGHAAEERLRILISDYTSVPIPATQRLFLMEAIGNQFPTYGAELLAAHFLETESAHPGEARLEPGGLPDVWKLTGPRGRVIALYRSATVVAAIRGLASGVNSTLSVTPPDGALPSAGESIAAGSRLPGWQLSLSPVAGGPPFDELVRRQRVSYIWFAILAIAVVALTALAAASAFRRHWQLARLKTDLVAAVSHELKTPLASMRLLVDSLLDDESPDARKTHEYLELIARENLRLSRLIENFLTFSRLERNRQKFDFALTRPEHVIDAALRAAHERLHAPDCQLDVKIEPGLPMVRADEDALVTVLLNLLDNACKYTPGEKHVGLRAYGTDGDVVFAVDDNGIGIPAREQKRIFRRFYQVDRRLARESGGCGLGLSIVEFITRAHGGDVRVKSQPGAGSTFSVVLPGAAGEKGAAA
jgi:signal transduction histidine kinase